MRGLKYLPANLAQRMYYDFVDLLHCLILIHLLKDNHPPKKKIIPSFIQEVGVPLQIGFKKSGYSSAVHLKV